MNTDIPDEIRYEIFVRTPDGDLDGPVTSTGYIHEGVARAKAKEWTKQARGGYTYVVVHKTTKRKVLS